MSGAFNREQVRGALWKAFMRRGDSCSPEQLEDLVDAILDLPQPAPQEDVTDETVDRAARAYARYPIPCSHKERLRVALVAALSREPGSSK